MTWITSRAIFEDVSQKVDQYVDRNQLLPGNLRTEMIAVGYEEEAVLRQTAGGLKSIIAALRKTGNDSFTSLWLDADPQRFFDIHGVYPGAFVEVRDLTANDDQDLLDVMSGDRHIEIGVGDEFGRWCLSPADGSWLIYAERYQSEAAIVLARDLGPVRILRESVGLRAHL